jgi:hypothetical protein
MRIGNTVQRYFNMMVEMETKKKFEISKLLKQFRVSGQSSKIFKELKLIEKVDNPNSINKKSHWYMWITNKPTMNMAEEALFFVNEHVKSYAKGTIPPVITRKKKEPLVVAKEMKPLTDEICIEHLRKSTEYVYEIFRSKKERIL